MNKETEIYNLFENNIQQESNSSNNGVFYNPNNYDFSPISKALNIGIGEEQTDNQESEESDIQEPEIESNNTRLDILQQQLFNDWMRQLEQQQIAERQQQESETPLQEQPQLELSYSDKPLKEKRQAYIQFFVNKGLTRAQAAGIVGNLEQESGLKHNAVGDNGTSYGLAQFHNERRDALFQKYGNNPTDMQQLEFIWQELNSTEKSALQALKVARTIEDATEAICKKYERPKAEYANLNKRKQYAQRAYDNIV